MAGKKGRSGRPTVAEEVNRVLTIRKAWEIAHRTLDGKKAGPQQFDMSKVIVARSIPEEVIHSGQVAINIVNYGRKPAIDTEATVL